MRRSPTAGGMGLATGYEGAAGRGGGATLAVEIGRRPPGWEPRACRSRKCSISFLAMGLRMEPPKTRARMTNWIQLSSSPRARSVEYISAFPSDSSRDRYRWVDSAVAFHGSPGMESGSSLLWLFHVGATTRSATAVSAVGAAADTDSALHSFPKSLSQNQSKPRPSGRAEPPRPGSVTLPAGCGRARSEPQAPARVANMSRPRLAWPARLRSGFGLRCDAALITEPPKPSRAAAASTQIGTRSYEFFGSGGPSPRPIESRIVVSAWMFFIR